MVNRNRAAAISDTAGRKRPTASWLVDDRPPPLRQAVQDSQPPTRTMAAASTPMARTRRPSATVQRAKLLAEPTWWCSAQPAAPPNSPAQARQRGEVIGGSPRGPEPWVTAVWAPDRPA